MNYIPLQDYSRQWIFRHKDLPVASEDLQKIRPMTASRSRQFWQSQISAQSDDHSFFQADDWAGNGKTWQEEGHWQQAWESDSDGLPDLIDTYFDWELNTVVFICYDSEHVIETTWDVFRRCWKNFLFIDDGTLLLGRKRKQVAQFFDTGLLRVGQRP